MLFGVPGAVTSALKPLINCKALGAMGQTGGFVDCTTLLDKQKQSITDLPDGPANYLFFIDT
ncbi:phage tail protein, partial [Klebsiella pneumoniae]